MKRISIVGTLALVLGLLAITSFSCKTGSDIEDKEWVLESFEESGNLVAPIAGTEITLTFDSTKDQVRGSAGCNSYFGGYKANGTKLSIDQLGHTEMYCMDPEGTMDQETNYLSALINAKSYELKDGKLLIDCGEQTLMFVTRENLPSTTMPPLDGGRSTIGIEISCDEFSSQQHITKEIEITYPGELIVTLCSNPTTGFQWSEDANIGDETVLQQYEHNFIPPEGTGVVGAAGKDVWTFKSLKAGTTIISFDYSRPWEGVEKGEWTFELTVNIKQK